LLGEALKKLKIMVKRDCSGYANPEL
jgi:hypothetical protein